MFVNIKIERINHMIMEEISKIIMLEVKDEDIKFITITGCDTSTDLSYCKIYFTVLDKERKEKVLKALDKASSFIRSELKFIYDESIEYGEHIDELLDQINEDK